MYHPYTRYGAKPIRVSRTRAASPPPKPLAEWRVDLVASLEQGKMAWESASEVLKQAPGEVGQRAPTARRMPPDACWPTPARQWCCSRCGGACAQTAPTKVSAERLGKLPWATTFSCTPLPSHVHPSTMTNIVHRIAARESKVVAPIWAMLVAPAQALRQFPARRWVQQESFARRRGGALSSKRQARDVESTISQGGFPIGAPVSLLARLQALLPSPPPCRPHRRGR